MNLLVRGAQFYVQSSNFTAARYPEASWAGRSLHWAVWPAL